MVKKIKDFMDKGKRKEIVLGTSIALASAINSFASSPTGDSDLDTIVTTMETGKDTIKSGGLYIVKFVIGVAIVFFGARWLWNMWRGWMSKAQ